MTDQEWADLFELIDKAVDLPGFSAREKAELIRSKAVEFGSESNLDEFLAMLEPLD